MEYFSTVINFGLFKKAFKKYLENKYIQLIKSTILKDDINIILSYSQNNNVTNNNSTILVFVY